MNQAMYHKQYRQQDVMGASPLRLVIMAYDMAIRACEQKDFEKATKAICGLRDALDFDYPEVSAGLFRLYQWCLDCLRNGDYASAGSLLSELRGAWKLTEKSVVAQQSAVVTAPVYTKSLGNILT